MKPDAIQREIELARDALRARTEVEMGGARRARLWAAIEARQPPSRSWAWLRWSLIPAVALALLALFLPPRGDEVAWPRAIAGRIAGDGALRLGVRFEVAERLTIALDERAELDLAVGTIATLESDRSLILETGDIEANIALGAPVDLRTAEARVSAISACFDLSRTSERTTLRVTSGQVDLFDGETTAVISSGMVRVIEPARAELPPPPAAPEPQPRPETRSRTRSHSTVAAPKTDVIPVPEAPDPEREARARLARADELRRAGRLLEAAEAYEEAAQGLGASAIAEEALFREAQLYVELGRLDTGLSVLDSASRRFADGLLAPERTVLEANIRLTQGRPAEAREALETRSHDASSIMQDARVRVAESLASVDREGARALLDFVIARGAPAAKARATALRRELVTPGGRINDVDPKSIAPAAHE